jgi:hypothetical protein
LHSFSAKHICANCHYRKSYNILIEGLGEKSTKRSDIKPFAQDTHFQETLPCPFKIDWMDIQTSKHPRPTDANTSVSTPFLVD